MDTIKILLTDDHSLVRDGIKALLDSESDLEVIGEASNGLEAIDLVIEKKPDLLIIDIRMPGLSGIETTQKLQDQNNPIKTIILSMHDSEEYILKSVKAGASGYLLKDTGKTEFIKAIHTVYNGGKYYSGDLSNVLINNLSQNTTPAEERETIPLTENRFDLTGKELQILSLVLSGLTNKEISEKLQKSKRTIETHRFNLMRKMNVKNLMDLSREAHKHGLV